MSSAVNGVPSFHFNDRPALLIVSCLKSVLYS
jgi:hypothetical protein